MNATKPSLTEELLANVIEELADLSAHQESHASDAAPVALDQQSVGRLSRVDAMQRQSMAAASAERRKARIAALHAARARIEAGEFGYCANCDEPIAPGRLKADPTVPLCVACAGIAEGKPRV